MSGPSIKTCLLSKHLRSHVFWTPAVGIGELVGPYAHFTKPEVGYFQIPVFVDHDVFRLDVPINDLLAVQVLDSEQDLDETIPSLIFTHPPNFPQVIKELSARAILKCQGNEMLSLESVVQA